MIKRLVFICTLLSFLMFGCTSPEATEVATVSTETPFPTLTITRTQTQVPPTLTPTITNTATLMPPTTTPTPEVNYRIYGVNLGPYLYEDPNLGAYITESDLRSLIERVAPYTTSIRTFGCGNGLDKAAGIAHEFGLTIAAGAWLGKDLASNEAEISCLINLANNGDLFESDLAVIGNEALLRGDLTESELMIYINRFKAEVPWVPVTSAESWTNIEKYQDLISLVDVVAVNVYPYWDNTPIDHATNAVNDWYLEFHDIVMGISPNYGYTDGNGDFVYVSKEIIVTETGWPTCGENGGTAEQSFYFDSFTSFARAYDLKYYWFEAYDETWKVAYEGEAGGCWGLWDNLGNQKEGHEKVYSGIVGGESTPEIEFVDSPDIQGWPNIQGMAWHIIPKDYRVVVYIFVPDAGGWWIKPSFDFPLTEIEDSGYWQCKIITGGIDGQATKISAFLIPVEYSPPLAAGWEALPQELFDNSIASTSITK
jgi:exo-beta-1,3-glucanase (GH17 family)